jgi:hypothetical protein
VTLHKITEIYTELLSICPNITSKFCITKLTPCARTWRFITALTTARHRSLSWDSRIQSTPPKPISLRSILIPSYHLRLGLPSGLFPSGFPTKTFWKRYGCPKVAISDGQSTFLYESPDTKACGDLSLKHIISSLRRVQQKTNEFPTKLVHEQCSHNMYKRENVAEVKGKYKMQIFS